MEGGRETGMQGEEREGGRAGARNGGRGGGGAGGGAWAWLDRRRLTKTCLRSKQTYQLHHKQASLLAVAGRVALSLSRRLTKMCLRSKQTCRLHDNFTRPLISFTITLRDHLSASP